MVLGFCCLILFLSNFKCWSSLQSITRCGIVYISLTMDSVVLECPSSRSPCCLRFIPFYLLLTIQKCFYFISWDLLWLAAHFEAYFNLKVFKYKSSQMIKSVNKSLIMICKVRDFRKTRIKIINGANVKGFVACFLSIRLAPHWWWLVIMLSTKCIVDLHSFCIGIIWFLHKLYTGFCV